jgi:hypothetical protein
MDKEGDEVPVKPELVAKGSHRTAAADRGDPGRERRAAGCARVIVRRKHHRGREDAGGTGPDGRGHDGTGGIAAAAAGLLQLDEVLAERRLEVGFDRQHILVLGEEEE